FRLRRPPSLPLFPYTTLFRSYRRGGRAVPCDIGGLGRHFLHHLGAHVLDRILELDLLRDGDPILGDRRVPKLLVDDDVATLGTEDRKSTRLNSSHVSISYAVF